MSLSVNSSPNRFSGNSNFGTLYPQGKKEKPVDAKLSGRERTGVAVSSAVGVAAALAILAKTATWKRFSLNPKKIVGTKIKDTYLYQAKFEEKEIITMAAGSIAGGLTGGLIIDKRSNNDKAELKSKVGEAIIQFGNACVPILTVGLGARTGDKIEKKIVAANLGRGYDKTVKWLAKLPKIGLILGGLAVGMVLGNRSANYLKKELLDSYDDRKIKPADMFMHWDDLCVAASFLSDGPIVQGFARLVPLAMLMAGYQVGCKGLDHQYMKQDKSNTSKFDDKAVKENDIHTPDKKVKSPAEKTTDTSITESSAGDAETENNQPAVNEESAIDKEEKSEKETEV